MPANKNTGPPKIEKIPKAESKPRKVSDTASISSSMGDVCRQLMQTLGVDDTSPAEFFEFWRMKQHTSSFDFFETKISPVSSVASLDTKKDEKANTTEEEEEMTDAEKYSKAIRKLNNFYKREGKYKDTFGYYMESVSMESIASQTTKPSSEKGEDTGEEEEEDESFEESDYEMSELMKWQYEEEEEEEEESETDSGEYSSGEDVDSIKARKREKKKAKAAALVNAKVAEELEEVEDKRRREEEIDELLRTGSLDSCLMAERSLGTLSDSIFDYCYHKKITPDHISSEHTDEEEEERRRAERDRESVKINPKLDPARIEAEKKRIEANLKEAVQCRSAMGTYIPPKGKRPLTKYFDSSSPGPAAYYPQQKLTKGIIMTSRWKDSIYETIGPGPGMYNPAACIPCTAKMLNLHVSERFEKSETVGPGPGVVNISPANKTGKEKPHALILSRRAQKKVGCGEGEFTNCYGLTRRGRAHPPNAIIISKHPPKDKSEPGPGAYDSQNLPDRRVGIVMKSRIPELGPSVQSGFVALPDTMGEGPMFSFGIRQFRIENNDTPGPIYKIPLPKRKPISLTFKPFPMRGRESEPSPVEYGNNVMSGSLKILPKAPVALLTGRNYPNFGNYLFPGPNHYNIRGRLGYDGPLQKGRWTSKSEVLPGPADFVPNNKHFRVPPRAVFQHKHKEKPLKENSPGFVYTPIYAQRIPGGLMSGRWKSAPEQEHAPEFKDLTGFTRFGQKSRIPLSLKSRHTPFKHNGVSTSANPPIENPCRNATYYY